MKNRKTKFRRTKQEQEIDKYLNKMMPFMIMAVNDMNKEGWQKTKEK